MEELLNTLEMQIRHLIDRQAGLMETNDELLRKKAAIRRENDALAMKQKQVVNQIASLVTKLKAIEKLP